MKIAILTLPLHTNYGGILQAYALQTVLERMGHEVKHLQPKVEYHRLHNPAVMPLVWIKRLYLKFCRGESQRPVFHNPYKWVRENTDRFISENLKCHYLKPEEWNEKLSMEYDAIIVGSDQVWRSLYSPDVTRYFTSFLGHSDIKRISYAASFGVDINEFSEEQLTSGREYLKLFSSISVREESGIRMCKELFNVDAQQVLDPTMLLSREDYQRFASTAPKSPGNLMVYILDQSEKENSFLLDFVNEHNYIPFYTNSKIEKWWSSDVPISECRQPPLETWLRGFADAEFVITDSFHACVFSILFHKPFGVFINPNRGYSRIESLLKPLGLMGRCINSTTVNLDKPIDWELIDNVLMQKAESSLGFMKQALNKM